MHEAIPIAVFYDKRSSYTCIHKDRAMFNVPRNVCGPTLRNLVLLTVRES